jgi:hypothetical protein
MNEFLYKVLLVDDHQDPRSRRASSLPSVEFTHFRSVDEVLEKIFNVTDIMTAKWKAFRHDYDLVLLDFELEENQLEIGKHPLGGMSLFPLFVGTFRGLGDCVVVNYSDKLDKTERLRTLKRIFEIGQSIQHKRDIEEIRQVGFKDFNLVPLIKQRAASILLQIPQYAWNDIRNRVTEANSVSDALKIEISWLSALWGKKVTLGDLRPDVGRPAYASEVQSPNPQDRCIIDTDVDDWLKWLGELERQLYWPTTIYKLYRHSTVNDFDHNTANPSPKDFWKKRLQRKLDGGWHFYDENDGSNHPWDLNIPPLVAQQLLALTWTGNLNRCKVAHQYFRLSIIDNQKQRSGRPYPEGYFLDDLFQPTGISYSLKNSYNARHFPYVYVPQPILRTLVTSIVAQTGKNNVLVELREDGQYVQFSCSSKEEIKEEDLVNLSKRLQANPWGPLPLIREWGDFLAMTMDEDPFYVGTGGIYADAWIASGWQKSNNCFVLRFATEIVREG